MTKRVYWLPSERVDVPDMEDGTNGLSVGLAQQFVDRVVLDHFARVMAGFRVQIANQVTAPGEFTVFNGVAFDRSGQILQNEDEENTSRSATLLANATYYVEVQFVASATGVDARGFWDPTYDNGTDPSGDARLPGREFAENVATRISPDWQIVTPISTTGFDITTNANSTRVPVAILTLAGGVISGASTSPPVTVLENSVLAAATKLKCFNTVEFPDSFTALIGAEAVSITNNDRVNGILTLSAGLVSNHAAGERFTQTGSPNQFLVDRVNQALPTAGTTEARPRMWQGFADRGYALLQDPFSATGRSNTSVQSLKDKVDELTAEIRELKFGAERDADIGITGPPVVFPDTPNEYDLSGGVTGARTNSCSIGDGVNTWGDFNISKYADAAACYTAAIAWLGGAGGKITIKRGSHDFPSTVTLPSSGLNDTPIIFEGEGVECTELNVTGTTPIFGGGNFHVIFKNLRLSGAAGAPGCVGVTTANKLAVIQMENCRIEGLYAVDHSAIQGYFRNVVFRVASTGNPYPLKGDFQNATFQNCEFDGSQVNGATTRAVLIGSPATASLGTDHLTFTDCIFETPSSALAAVEFNSVGGHNYVTFERCDFSTTSVAAIPGILAMGATTPVAITDLWVRDCVSNMPGGLADLDNLVHAHIVGCELASLLDGGSNGIMINSLGSQDVHIEKCRFFQGANSATSSIGVNVDNCIGLTITGCEFAQNDVAIQVNNVSEATIRDNHYVCGGGTGRAFVLGVAAGSLVDSSIVDNHIQNPNDPTSGSINGVALDSMVVTSVNISGNTFTSMGGALVGASVSAISVQANNNNQVDRVTISDNIITDLDSTAGFASVAIVAGAPNGFAAFNISISRNIITTVGATSLAVIGIDLLNTSTAQVVGNRLLTIGNTGDQCVGIAIAASSNAVVAHNVIRALSTSSDGAAIKFTQFGHAIVVNDNVVDPQSTNANGISIVQVSGSTVPFFDVTIKNNFIGSADSGSVSNGVFVQFKGSAGVLTRRIAVDGNQIRGWVGSAIWFQPVLSGTDVITDVSVCGNNMMNNQNNANAILLKTLQGPFTCNNNNIYLKETTADAKCGIFLSSCDYGNVCGNMIKIGNTDGTFAFIYLDNTAGGSGIAVHMAGNNLAHGSAVGTSNGIRAVGSAPTDMTAAANVTRSINTPYTNVHTAGDTGVNQNQ